MGKSDFSNFRRKIGCIALVFGIATSAHAEMVEIGPRPNAAVLPYLRPVESASDPASLITALRAHVRYVFVLFQENRSFDHYFGTFPGAEGLFRHKPEETPGFVQPIRNQDGSIGSISPFRIGPKEGAADLDDLLHTRAALLAKLDFVAGRARMDHFALTEEHEHSPSGKPSRLAKQFGELPLAYVDCDTIPLLWNYASRFVLFDAFFETALTPSAPNAVAVIAGQTGLTQWLKHPELSAAAGNDPNAAGVPMTGNLSPYWGSSRDKTSGMPRNPYWNVPGVQINQTYASLPLTLAQEEAARLAETDRSAQDDLADVARDLPAIARAGRPPVPWGWYQEGYDREPTDPAGSPPEGTHRSYVTHHNGPQYFGYIANNPQMRTHLHGLADFFADLAARRLPPEGGVFYVRGGFRAISGELPANPSPSVRARFRGDDDHPGYADSELSEALLARAINAIAQSPYWEQSVILITYDESGGFYDHVPPPSFARDPAGRPLSAGMRVPTILISPFARVHAISHEQSDHGSILRLIEAIFDLPTLADLPEEHAAREQGKARYGEPNLAPSDGVAGFGSLLSGFDPARLNGTAPLLPPAYALVPEAEIAARPHFGGKGCAAIGVVPEDMAKGIRAAPPPDFNPRPATEPNFRSGE
jgi:phospholipase C